MPDTFVGPALPSTHHHQDLNPVSVFEAFVEVFAGDPCLVVDEDLHFEVENAGLVVEGGGGAFAFAG